MKTLLLAVKTLLIILLKSQASTDKDNAVIRLRNWLLSLLELCFAQYIPSSDEQDDDEMSKFTRKFLPDQIAFADFVQLTAGKVTSDLRTLFPKEFADAASPILRSLPYLMMVGWLELLCKFDL